MPKIIPIYTTVPGQGFTVLDLDLGEIALNVNDGTLYLKKETGGASSVVILAGSGSSVVTASYALTSSYASYANVALNATNSLNSLFSIYSLHSYYSQIARTASFAYRADYSEFAVRALTSTNASTASLPIRGIITASAAGSTITFTKGDNSTFNVSVTTATAETASYVTSSNVDGPYGKNSILSASYALTSSLPLQGLITASAAGSIITFTKGDSSTFNITITTATAETASYVSSSNVDGPFGKNSILSASYAVTASYVLNAVSASYALSSSQAVSASYALSASQAVSSSFALSASFAQTASYAPSSLSASYASTASNVEGGTTNYITLWRTNTALTSSVIYQSGSNITVGGGAVLPSAKLEVKGAGSTSATAALNAINASSTTLLYLRNDGFVGIGTASAASTENMYVKKQWSVFNQGTDLTNYTIIDVSNTTSTLRLGVETNSGGNILAGTTAYAGIIGTINNFPLQFITNNTVKATLLNTGNFGIGITSPLYTLDVSGSARITSSVFLPGLTSTSQVNLVNIDTASGQLYYVATSSFTASWANNAISASNAISSSYPFRVTGSSILSYNTSNVSSNNSFFVGVNAGDSTNAFRSNFLGQFAGDVATNANQSNFLGYRAGQSAENANNSNFLGSDTGRSATNAANSNFLGGGAGNLATNANDSNFLGNTAGLQATNAAYSNFLGRFAGQQAINASFSNFLGLYAGRYAASASYSILIGYQAGYNISSNTALGIKSNNIIIGTNITLVDGRQDSINIGGLLFGTGSYSTITGNPFSGSAGGRIGINQPLPIYNFQVSGTVGFPNLTNINQTNVVGFDTTTGQLYYQTTSSLTTGTASYVTSSNVFGPFGSNSILSASYAVSSSQAQNAVTASYVLNAISASYAATASSADNFTVRGTLTAQTIVAQVITSSTDFVTGSTRFGTLLSNTHQFTGSVSITGSLNVVGAGITGSLFGTASWANNAITASNALTASYILNAVSSSFAATASNILGGVANYVPLWVGTTTLSTSSISQINGNINVSGSTIITGSLTILSGSRASGSLWITPFTSSGMIILDDAEFLADAARYTYPQIRTRYTDGTIYRTGITLTNNNEIHLISNAKGVLATKTVSTIPRIVLANDTWIQWSNAETNGFTLDTTIRRISAGVLQVTSSLIAGSFTGSLQGTASWANNALTASFVTSSRVFGPYGSNSILSASYALTASFALNGGGGLSGGTTNYIPIWTSATTLGSSAIYQTNGNINISGSTFITGSLIVSSSNSNGLIVSSSQTIFTLPNTSTSAVIISSSLASSFRMRLGTTSANQYSWLTNIYYDGANFQKDDTSRSGWRMNQVAETTDVTSSMEFNYFAVGTTTSVQPLVIKNNRLVITNQILPTNTGSVSFVNYAFNNTTSSGFYGSGSNLDSVKLSFNGADKFEFSSSGMFRAADDLVGFYSFSDRNLKHDIRQIYSSIALDQIQQLQGVYYKWVGNQGSRANREEIGLIAQDVEKVVPQLVREQERLGQGTFKTIDYDHLTALLIEAVKEQQKQINELKIKLDALSTK